MAAFAADEDFVFQDGDEPTLRQRLKLLLPHTEPEQTPGKGEYTDTELAVIYLAGSSAGWCYPSIRTYIAITSEGTHFCRYNISDNRQMLQNLSDRVRQAHARYGWTGRAPPRITRSEDDNSLKWSEYELKAVYAAISEVVGTEGLTRSQYYDEVNKIMEMRYWPQKAVRRPLPGKKKLKYKMVGTANDPKFTHLGMDLAILKRF